MIGSILARLVTQRAQSLSQAAGAALECVSSAESICVASVGSLEHLDNSRCARDRSLGAACMQAISPLICNNICADRRFDAPFYREAGVHQILSVSRQWPAGEHGVLTVVNGQADFTAQNAQALEVLMDLLSTSIVDVPDETAGVTLTQLGESGYQQVLDAIADMVLVKSRQSRIVWGNKAFREVYRMSNEQLRGLTDSRISEPDHTQKYVQDDKFVFDSGTTLDIPEEPVTRHDGSLRSFHTVKSPIFDTEGKVVMTVGVSRDITELEAVGRLAAGVAHEINTPMQFIGDNTTFLRSGFEALLKQYARSRSLCERALTEPVSASDWSALMQAEQEEDLPFLQAECSKAFDSTLFGITHVSQIIAALKVFAHTDHADKEWVDINQLLKATLTIAAHQLKPFADVDTEFGDIPRVAGYAGELNQVFLNLLINAAHAIEDVVAAGGQRGRIRIRSYCENDEVIASIADTGAGIPKEIQSRVFEQFFTTKGIGRGTGQGLALAHAIVADKHEGRLVFDTVPGLGTTFYVCLRQPRPDATADGLSAAPDSSEP
jgi:PAS domain S-box-containing protein